MGRLSARKLQAGVFGGAVGVVAVASAAWACTFQPRFVSLTDQFGPRGSTVTVTGEGAAPGGAVDLRWNAVRGLQLASTTADERGSFRATVTIPDVAPEVYALFVIAENNVGRAAFEVTADAPLARVSASSAPAGPWSDAAAPGLGTRGATPADSEGNIDFGAALLGVGVVALASGAGVVAVRRRRAPVRSIR